MKVDLKQGLSFEALKQSSYTQLEHASSLKGLLKPFKGKGELEDFALQCRLLEAGLISLATDTVIPRAGKYPFSLLPIRLTQQKSASGAVFLRWRRCDRSKMGADVWAEVLADSRTPTWMLKDLHALESQRIELNMQISLIHTIARQANECVAKMSSADQVLSDRLAESFIS